MTQNKCKELTEHSNFSPPTYNVRLNVHVTEDMLQKIDTLAMKEQKKRSELVRQILKAGVQTDNESK